MSINNSVLSENEDGYRLWLRYEKITDTSSLEQYRKQIENAAVLSDTDTAIIIRQEISNALPAMLDKKINVLSEYQPGNGLVIGTETELAHIGISLLPEDQAEMSNNGYLIRTIRANNATTILITARADSALLTGTFHFLRLLQTYQDIGSLGILSRPKIQRRILGHWDNLDGSIERGYAGRSLWKWEELPDTIDERYIDYARACASIGLNGTVLNNVNSQPEILRADYLNKVAALSDVFRPYGIRVYLSVPFDAPIRLGNLDTADPGYKEVQHWWKDKAGEIYGLIPDFGGFEVKACSEGQPGPQDYGANHDDGANMLAEILAPYGGIVLWRAFVYDTTIDSDRAKCAYKEFVPLDGTFRENAFVQVKNGPVDFQPREPFHPLFGALPETKLAMEFQITQEYLGQAEHLVYLAPMWKEVLDADTFARGQGSEVGDVIDGSLYGNNDSAIIGVANTGSDRNWCGHHFAQANWYAFGRLAWDHTLSAETICEEWGRMTWSNNPEIVTAIREMMMGSWEACIDYMTPLGLHHIMQEGHHYGPDPAFNSAPREDWNSVYYNRADSEGLGFNRSSTGSNAVSQYFSPLREQFNSVKTCPEKFLLWFHHIPWSYLFPSGRNLIEELEYHYNTGVDYVAAMAKTWEGLRNRVDSQRHQEVSCKLKEQLENARLWQDVCLKYFRQFTRKI